MKIILTSLLVLIISPSILAQTKIDEYGYLISDDEGGRLHGISQIFLTNKDSKIYILINKKKEMPFGSFLRYFYGVERWLTWMKIPKESIVMVAGEEMEKQLTQIWSVKNNENLPVFKEISIEEKLKEKISKKTLFDTNCIDCDQSPFVRLFILREGVDYLAKSLRGNPQSKAFLQIARVEYLSKTVKERQKLLKQIFDRLKDNGIEKSRVSIQFTSGDMANFYLVPN